MNREMLMLVDAISREKSVEREVVFGAVEAALASATKKLQGGERAIREAGDRDDREDGRDDDDGDDEGEEHVGSSGGPARQAREAAVGARKITAHRR